MADHTTARQSTAASIHSSPGSSSLPSPPSSPQNRPRSRGAHPPGSADPSHNHNNGQGPQGHVVGGQHNQFESLPGSPLSIASSFPSGASSYMFSHSASSSPPHIDPALLAEHGYGHHGRHHRDTDEDVDPLGLVIPSLSLPPPLSAAESGNGPTSASAESSGGGRGRGQRGQHHRTHYQSPYGETLGTLELFIFGRKGAGKTAIANMLVEGNDDIVSVLGWEDGTLTASTAWKEPRSRRGARNVRITEVKGFDEEEDEASEIVQPLLRAIHERFESVAGGLSSELPASQQVMDMLASSNSPLPTALLFLLSSPPTPLELTLLSLISTHIPTITLPPYPSSVSTLTSFSSNPQTSQATNVPLGGSNPTATIAQASFRPRNTLELRTGLFRSPATLKGLRYGAAERFEHWREIRNACKEMGLGSFVIPPSLSMTLASRAKQDATRGSSAGRKDGEKTLAETELERRRKLEWELRLSRDVAEAFDANARKGNTRTPNIKRDPELTLVSMEEGPSTKLTQDLPLPLGKEKHESTREDEDPRYFFQPDVIGEPDPLHLPTLFRLSSALLGALGKRLVASLVERNRPRSYNHGLYAGGEYVGVGVKAGSVGEEVDYYEEEAGWSLSKWGIAGIAFAIGYCAARMLAKSGTL